MNRNTLGRRFATIIRRYPKLMFLPYHLYRFIQPKYSIGVVGILFNPQKEVLLVEHVFHPQKPWGLPGGWIDPNEDPAHAVEREFQEELSLTVTVNRIVMLRRTQRNHLDIAYLCTAQNNTVGQLSYELIQYRWFSLAQLPHLHYFHHDAIHTAYQQRETNAWDA